MTIKDLLIEGILFGGKVQVGGTDNSDYWSGRLHPETANDLRAEDGSLPAWFDAMEVVGIGPCDEGLVMLVQ